MLLLLYTRCLLCCKFYLAELPELEDNPIDQWTQSKTGGACWYDRSQTSACAVCRKGGCQCGRQNANQCVQCGHLEQCGLKVS
jgi:hypothetical protein